MRNFGRFRFLYLALDVLLFEAAFFGIFWWRFETGIFVNPVGFGAAEVWIPGFIVSAYWIVLLAWFGLYRFDPLHSRAAVAGRSIRAVALGILVLFILTFDPQRPLPSSRIILGAYGLAVFAIVGGNRVGLLTILRFLRIRGIGRFRTLIIGAGQHALGLIRYTQGHPGLGMDVCVTLLGQHETRLIPDSIPIGGHFSDLRSLLRGSRFDAVLIAPDEQDERDLFRILRLLSQFRIRAFVSADQYQLLLGAVKPSRVPGHPLVEIRPELLSVVERFLKRLTDIALSIILAVLTAPIWIFLIIAIPLDSPGKPIYRQRRVGLGGRLFTMYKFRSMDRDAEEHTGPVLAQENDPRITRIGRFIRSTRLDELPQLINVLSGQMSMVGPRPERAEFVERFVHEIPLYERRINVKPGLTGWSQVHLKYDSRADQTAVKLQHDFFYIENMSLPLDIKIMFMTMFVVLRGEGL